jgi:hypothetical protein
MGKGIVKFSKAREGLLSFASTTLHPAFTFACSNVADGFAKFNLRIFLQLVG